VDCSAFGGANPATAPATFLSVGRFTAKKAPDLTLRAFARVRQKVPGAQLRMVGFGPLLEPCRKLAGELGLDGAVTFLGACPPPVIQGEMRRARCFVQHSIVAPDGDSEGTPVSILEAGASGLPVVSTRHAGIPDVVLDGVTGLLVEEGDVEGMACALVRLALDPDLAARLGQAARQRIAEHFSLPDRIGRLWAILDSCIAGAPLSARRPGEGSGVHSCYPDPGGAGGRPCASR
jgi:glycosyltransferase involved in cell wall biosynthesis